MLKINLGNKERMVRGVLGLIVLLIAFFAGLPDTAISVVGIIGSVILLTALMGFCPIYFIIHRSTKED